MGAAMNHAVLEPLEDEDKWYAHIPGFSGLWAVGKTQEEARQELYLALDGWLHVNSFRGTGAAPTVDGLNLSDPPDRTE